MASETRLSDTYDRIAQWYDVDMARNMRFDDVRFYADLCQREGGRVLELGCGNGRVLLELVCRNIDAVGIDTSRKMLQQLQHKAKARGLAPSACRMDARKLAFARSFDIVLCPYSLVTYMAQPDDLERMMSEVRQVLRADGLLVVDAFIPRDTVASGDYRLDYCRPFGDEVLQRQETRDLVNATMAQLPDHYRESLEEKYVQGRSQREMAERWQLTEKALESQLTRARNAFRVTFLALSRPLQPEVV